MLRISTPAVEGTFQAAKWLKIQALLDVTELADLFAQLDPFAIYPLTGALPLASFPMPQELYLAAYRSSLENVFQRSALPASLWSSSPEAVWLQELPGERYVARGKLPFVQVQVHHMGYSDVDGVFRAGVLSRDSIFWGLQFAFPQVFEDPEAGIIPTNQFFNFTLFKQIQKWIRDCTIATPMEVAGVRKNLSIRLGKKCFPWINRHPQLKTKGLRVLELYHDIRTD